MSSVVPAPGWSVVFGGVPVAAYYGVLGPFTADDYIKRVWLSFSVDAAGPLILAGSLCAGDGATAENVASGVPLIRRSALHAFGQPAFGATCAAGVSPAFVLPVGARGSAGARFIVMVLSTLGPATSQLCCAGAEVQRVVAEGVGG